MFDLDAFDDHQEVVHLHQPAVGLSAIVAIHDTTLGPALGGCRMWRYASAADATRDALRLAQGMTFKNALAGLPFGGGKSVIIGDPARDKSRALFEAFGEAVDRLGGRYIAAEDVGITEADARIVRSRTRHVTGVGLAGVGGDPSPKTARGVFKGLEAAVRISLGRSDVGGVRVAVQGLGAVGWKLAALLRDAGAELIVADLDGARVEQAEATFGARVVDVASILTADVDVLAPCALGGVLNADSIPTLGTKIIAGAANNQLAHAGDGDAIAARGIIYVPDYVVNAGGVIAVAHEYLGVQDEQTVWAQVDGIAGTVQEVLDRAMREATTPARAADTEARLRLGADTGKRTAA